MTPAEQEATLIVLWTTGLETAEIAQRLSIPKGTVQSRAHRLQQRGLIQPRPRGGAYPSQRALARQDDPPAPARAPAPAGSSFPTRDPPAITFMAVPEVRELIHTVKDLVVQVATLEASTRADTRTPPAPAPARVDIEQWTVRLSKALIERIKAEAVAAQKPPSHLLEELAWKALNDQSPSMP
jgi:DNA-binding transcriptional MocR family regulator